MGMDSKPGTVRTASLRHAVPHQRSRHTHTLGTGCATLGGDCVGDVVGVNVSALLSTNLSNSCSSWLPLLFVIPFHASIQLAMAFMIFFGMGDCWIRDSLVIELGGVS